MPIDPAILTDPKHQVLKVHTSDGRRIEVTPGMELTEHEGFVQLSYGLPDGGRMFEVIALEAITAVQYHRVR